MPASYTYLGPEGTFTEAALRTLPEAATRELVPMVSVPAALDAVRNGEAEAAFVPIENSVEGGITDDPRRAGRRRTADDLPRGAAARSPSRCWSRPGTKLSEIKTVTGHPAAQPQVRNWMKAQPPGRRSGSRRPRTRTAPGWCRRAATTRPSRASSRRPRYGLEPLVTGIHDAENAQTRFVLVGRPARPAAPTGADKTSVVIWLARRPPRCAAGAAAGVRRTRAST